MKLSKLKKYIRNSERFGTIHDRRHLILCCVAKEERKKKAREFNKKYPIIKMAMCSDGSLWNLRKGYGAYKSSDAPAF